MKKQDSLNGVIVEGWLASSSPRLAISSSNIHHAIVNEGAGISTEAASVTTNIAPPLSSTPTNYPPEIWESYQTLVQELLAGSRVKTNKLSQTEIESMQRLLYTNNNSNNEPVSFLNAQHQQYYVHALSYVADLCAKKVAHEPAAVRTAVQCLSVAWRKLMAISVVPRENTVSTYLYVLLLPKNDNEFADLAHEVSAFHTQHFSPNEKLATLRIPHLLGQDRPDEATKLAQSVPDSRLRTYLPILRYRSCRDSEPQETIALFQHMQSIETVVLDDEAYSLVFRAVAALPERKEELFHQLAQQMAAEAQANVLALKPTSADILRQSSFRAVNVTIRETDATCPLTHAQLPLTPLLPHEQGEIAQNLLLRAAEQHLEYSRKDPSATSSQDALDNVSNKGDFARRELQSFVDWLDVQRPKFTAVVDGPNVGYFGRGCVSFPQVQAMVDALRQRGEHALVVMPYKYARREKFWLTGIGGLQEVKPSDRAILNELEANGQLYVVPSQCLDDYYWMISSVVGGNSTPRGNTPDYLPGLRPLLITNDLMRDHHVSLMPAHLFRRWKTNHILNYQICAVAKPAHLATRDETSDQNMTVVFQPGPRFSQEIQYGLTPDGEVAWFFPLVNASQAERVCVLLPADKALCSGS